MPFVQFVYFFEANTMCQRQNKQLSPSQKREYLNCLRELQAEGICVDIPDEWLERSCPLDIVIAPPAVSIAFDWPSGGAGYVVGVRLLSHRLCMLEDCAVTVPWGDDVVIQSPDVRKSRCDFGPLAFSWDEVLNPRIENTLRFPRAGHVVQGVILGRGGMRIPKQYTSFTPVPFVLKLYDQYGEEITAQGHLSVGRKHTKVSEDYKRNRSETSEMVSRIGTEVPEENTDASTLLLSAERIGASTEFQR